MMTFVDPGAIGECDARTQVGSIGSLSSRPRTRQRAAGPGRATQRSLCESFSGGLGEVTEPEVDRVHELEPLGQLAFARDVEPG